MTFTKKLLAPLLAISFLFTSTYTFAEAGVNKDEDRPGMASMYADLLLMRPLGVVATVLGSAAFVISLPFTAPVGGVKEAGKVLVAEPAKFTFARCLGCTKTGYHHDEE